MATKFALLDEAAADYKKNGKLVGVFLKGPGPGPARPGKAEPNHVGLLFVDPAGQTREFHFVTDNKILSDVLKPTKPYFHAEIGLDEPNATVFASYLSTFLNEGKMPRIKYGMDWFAVLGSFDADGVYKFDDADDDPGLTCSLFVSELLNGRGYQLVDYGQWPQNQQRDLQWRAAKVAAYRAKGEFAPERLEAMENIDPFIRLRPEEVAAVAEQDYYSWAELKYRHEPLGDGEAAGADRQRSIEELAREVVVAFAEALP